MVLQFLNRSILQFANYRNSLNTLEICPTIFRHNTFESLMAFEMSPATVATSTENMKKEMVFYIQMMRKK